MCIQSRIHALLLVSTLAIGCGGGSGDTSGPDEGTLEVVVFTSGSDLDPDGYTLTVDNGTPRSLPTNGADTVESLSPGSHTLTLAGAASSCTVGGDNPRNVEISSNTMASVEFNVACHQTPAIFVSAETSGEELDPDGYQGAVDGGVPQPLPIKGTVAIAGVTLGEHDVGLLDVADNCVVAENNPLRVVVSVDAAANAHFTVTCTPVPPVPPGRDIAFARDGEVYLLTADGATLTNLTNDPAFDSDPAWSPDGQTIAFSSNRSGASQVYLMNADGSDQNQITNDGARDPVWSPDGSKIAFTFDEQIFVMHPDGSTVTQLTTTGGNTPAWSPGGTRIAFTRGGSFETDVFVMNTDGSNVTQLTAAPGIDINPDWSPDGTKIVFNSDRSGERHIHVMNQDGTNVRQLTFGNHSDIQPKWSPDGSKIAFSSAGAGAARIYMVNPDGTEQVPLTPSSFDADSPAWRP